MKSRENLVRLKQFQVNEKRRQLMQLDMMIAEFDRMANELDIQIASEEPDVVPRSLPCRRARRRRRGGPRALGEERLFPFGPEDFGQAAAQSEGLADEPELGQALVHARQDLLRRGASSSLSSRRRSS